MLRGSQDTPTVAKGTHRKLSPIASLSPFFVGNFAFTFFIFSLFLFGFIFVVSTFEHGFPKKFQVETGTV